MGWNVLFALRSDAGAAITIRTFLLRAKGSGQECPLHTNNSTRSLELRQEETRVLAVLQKSFAKLLGEDGFFFSGFDPIAEDDEGDSGDAAPAIDRQGSADGGQIKS